MARSKIESEISHERMTFILTEFAVLRICLQTKTKAIILNACVE